MRKPKLRTFDIRRSYASSGTTLVSLPKEQTKYMKLQPGDVVAVMQNRVKEKLVELKDGDIVIRKLNEVI